MIPLEWQNTKRKPVALRQPYLILRKLDNQGQETSEEYCFRLAGDYAEISTEAFKQRYRIRNAYILQPQSITSIVMVFHTQDWWDETSSEYQFHFATGQAYRVYIGYAVDVDLHPEQFLFSIEMYGNVNRLDRKTNFWWDYWYTDS